MYHERAINDSPFLANPLAGSPNETPSQPLPGRTSCLAPCLAPALGQARAHTSPGSQDAAQKRIERGEALTATTFTIPYPPGFPGSSQKRDTDRPDRACAPISQTIEGLHLQGSIGSCVHGMLTCHIECQPHAFNAPLLVERWPMPLWYHPIVRVLIPFLSCCFLFWFARTLGLNGCSRLDL